MKAQIRCAIGLWLWLSSGYALAQVDLDRPYPVWISDHVFYSATDPRVLYLIPKAITRWSPVDLEVPSGSKSDRLRARFQVGIDLHDYHVARSTAWARDKIPEISVLRPLEAEIIPASGTDLPQEFHPELQFLGEADLGGPVPMLLEVDRGRRLFGQDRGRKLFDGLFGAISGAPVRDHVATIRYSFSAVVHGAPVTARSAVALFVGARRRGEKDPYAGLGATGMLIRWEQEAGSCWDTVAPGEICVR